MESTEIYTKYLFKALLEIYEVSFWSCHRSINVSLVLRLLTASKIPVFPNVFVSFLAIM